jgi:hypothetical protein
MRNCKCGEQVTTKSSMCKKCAAKYASDKREKRHNEGLCLQCGTLNKGKPYCNKCQELRNKNAAAQYSLYKAKCVGYFSGKCADCGLVSEYNEVYDFHHLDPTIKDWSIAKLLAGRCWAKIIEELKKCVMICANCHRIRHAKEGRPDV